MAAEKKPRAARATAKTGTTRKTETKAKAKPAAAKTLRARKPKAETVPVTAVTPEMIAERAYHIWADGSGGDANAHWLRAERELTAA